MGVSISVTIDVAIVLNRILNSPVPAHYRAIVAFGQDMIVIKGEMILGYWGGGVEMLFADMEMFSPYRTVVL